MIRAIIADDEELSRRLVHQLLERHADVEIVADCADGAAARDAMNSLDPDVCFLDVRMPLHSGLDVARLHHRGTGPLVVFVSAFQKFALPAFEVDAVDYLIKPLTEERFDAAVERVRLRLRQGSPPSALPPHLVTRIGTREIIIPLGSVDYVEADDVYAAVVALGRRHLLRTSLDALEQTLDARTFARIHRSFIVRLDRIVEIRRAGDGGATVVLRGGPELPVSRRRRAGLMALLKPLTT